MYPELCILRPAECYNIRNRMTKLFAKSNPGANTMSAPIAGSKKMLPLQFLRLDLAGACLYIMAYGALGYLFCDFVAKITQGLQSAGHVLAAAIVVVVGIYLVYRVVQYRRYRISGVVPRIEVQELARLMASAEHKDIILADVRSHGYYDSEAARIAGSIRLEPNQLAEELKTLPKDKDIYLYCT